VQACSAAANCRKDLIGSWVRSSMLAQCLGAAGVRGASHKAIFMRLLPPH
jgi:hypothetical protein